MLISKTETVFLGSVSRQDQNTPAKISPPSTSAVARKGGISSRHETDGAADAQGRKQDRIFGGAEERKEEADIKAVAAEQEEEVLLSIHDPLAETSIWVRSLTFFGARYFVAM